MHEGPSSQGLGPECGPAHQAAYLAASEAARSECGHSILGVRPRDAAEVLLGEVQQLPVLHPCETTCHRPPGAGIGLDSMSPAPRRGHRAGQRVTGRQAQAQGRGDTKT